MPNQNPEKCQRCAKFNKSVIHDRCKICQELQFEESIFCHLNRCIQEPDDFTCYAFRPILNLVGSPPDPRSKRPVALRAQSRSKFFLNLIDSHKIKYQKALALQKLGRNPDEEFVELKYHFAWNMMQRKPIFDPEKDYFDFMYVTFLSCGESVGGFASLLWLTPDHLHVYVNSDGHESVEQIIQVLKQCVKNAIFTKFPKVTPGPEKETNIWDEAYFSETIG